MADPLPSLPKPHPTLGPKSLISFRVLSLDLYGTIIDFKPRVIDFLHPITSNSQQHDKYDASTASGIINLGALFKSLEDEITVNHPVRPFGDVLNDIYAGAAKRLDVQHDVAQAKTQVSHFQNNLKPFPDVLDALQRLRKYYQLVLASNVDATATAATVHSLLSPLEFGDYFKRIVTANDFSQDDPDRRKLEHVVAEEAKDGVRKEEILVVAQSLGHDHVFCKQLGVSSVFILRDSLKWGYTEDKMKGQIEQGAVGYGWRFSGLKELADAADEAYRELEGESK